MPCWKPEGVLTITDINHLPRALVTGAAGGLGREVSRQLSARGCAVAICDIDARGLAETARLLLEHGGEVESIVCDLTAEDAPQAAVERVVARWGGVDVLVNNAAYGVIEPFLEATHQAWVRTLALNVTALVMACKAAGRVMREQRSGRIINITSPGSRMALPDYTAYTASKASVDSITRAAAVAQLQTWGERNGVTVIAQGQDADPASVAFDALKAAKTRGADVLIADTAGRLHTQGGLMNELGKIRRVLGKLDPAAPHEVLMVVDGTTGQNALSQVRQFRAVVGVTGLVVTKLDGTAKGGVVFALAKEFGLPIRFVGIGEKAEDLREFDPEAFVDALLPEALGG